MLSPVSRGMKVLRISCINFQLRRYLVLLDSCVAIVPLRKASTRLSSVPRYIIGSSDSGISKVVVLVSVAEGSVFTSSDPQFVLGMR